MDGDCFGDTLFFHGYAIQCVGERHGFLVMGDDDEFISQSLDKLIYFLEKNHNLGYVLKSHLQIFKDGRVEKFRYFDGDQFFKAGKETYIELFRKSVFISGFTINRTYIQDILIDDFDGTLLF